MEKNRPAISFKVSLEVGPTESEEAIRSAIFRIFEDVPLSLSSGELSGGSSSVSDLEKLKSKVFERRILDTFRSRLIRNSQGNSTGILLHRQALVAGKVAVVDSESESPLGAVRISFSAESESALGNFINWISPMTREGVPVKDGAFSPKREGDGLNCSENKTGKGQGEENGGEEREEDFIDCEETEESDQS